MYYYGARWYDPSIGRFISQDPLAGDLSDPQSLNPYVYVTNTPTTLTDPTGLDGGFHDRPCSSSCSGGDPFSGIVSWWNGLPSWAKVGLVVAAAVALGAVAAVTLQPELLAAEPGILAAGGIEIGAIDVGAGAGLGLGLGISSDILGE